MGQSLISESFALFEPPLWDQSSAHCRSRVSTHARTIIVGWVTRNVVSDCAGSNAVVLANRHFSFRAMFLDSKIAATFSSKHTKTKSIICDAHLKKPVVDRSRLLCDESNERGDSVKLLIRVFEPENGKIVTRHLDTNGITDLTADGIFSSLEETLSKYHLSFDQLSFTSDTNVIKGAKNGVIAKLRAKQPKVIDVHCICHVVDLCKISCKSNT